MILHEGLERLVWIKRLFFLLFIGVMSFFIALNIFTGLKIKGYNYIFRATKPYDLVIKHAMILDGTGENEAFRGDIGIRDGYIVGVGYINAKDSPVFDGGGLTFIPAPVRVEKCEGVLEHLLSTSYPRYPAHEIFLLDPPYEGLSLAQAARAKGVTPEEMFKYLNVSPNAYSAKVLLAPLQIREDDDSGVKEMLARLTMYRAGIMGRKDLGCIRDGFRADMYVFKTMDYSEERLRDLFSKGDLPAPVYRIERGKFAANQ